MIMKFDPRRKGSPCDEAAVDSTRFCISKYFTVVAMSHRHSGCLQTENDEIMLIEVLSLSAIFGQK